MSLPTRLQNQALTPGVRRRVAVASAVVCAGLVAWAGHAPAQPPASAPAPTIRIGVTAPDGDVRVETLPLERALRAAGLAGRLRGLSIVDRTPSGRAGRMRVDGFTPNTLTAHEFRMAVGRMLG